jgi:hypothetical protein
MFWLKSDKNNGYFICRPTFVSAFISSVTLQMYLVYRNEKHFTQSYLEAPVNKDFTSWVKLFAGHKILFHISR